MKINDYVFPANSDVIHLFRYYTAKALCGVYRNHDDAMRDRVDRIPDTQPNCMSCIALRKDDGDVLFAYPASVAPTRKCYVTKDGLAHAVRPAPHMGWFFRLCEGSGDIIYAIEFKHLKNRAVTCLECLDALGQKDE